MEEKAQVPSRPPGGEEAGPVAQTQQDVRLHAGLSHARQEGHADICE